MANLVQLCDNMPIYHHKNICIFFLSIIHVMSVYGVTIALSSGHLTVTVQRISLSLGPRSVSWRGQGSEEECLVLPSYISDG